MTVGLVLFDFGQSSILTIFMLTVEICLNADNGRKPRIPVFCGSSDSGNCTKTRLDCAMLTRHLQRNGCIVRPDELGLLQRIFDDCCAAKGIERDFGRSDRHCILSDFHLPGRGDGGGTPSSGNWVTGRGCVGITRGFASIGSAAAAHIAVATASIRVSVNSWMLARYRYRDDPVKVFTR